MRKTGTYHSIREVGKVLTGLVLTVTTLPLQPILIARDIGQNGKYANDPDTIFYNARKPTPNTEDFHEGRPRANSAYRFNNWLRNTFFS